MAGGTQSPRQRMINLMYLVFIAMMAMNVDQEVLRSFEGLNTSIEQSANSMKITNGVFYDQIKKNADKDKSAQADSLKSYATKASEALATLKIELSKQVEEGKLKGNKETNYPALQNTDIVNKSFFKSEGVLSDNAQKAKKAVEDFTDYIVKSYKEPELKKAAEERIKNVFATSDREGAGWMREGFDNQPMIAAVTKLTKLQSDISTEENNKLVQLLAKGEIVIQNIPMPSILTSSPSYTPSNNNTSTHTNSAPINVSPASGAFFVGIDNQIGGAQPGMKASMGSISGNIYRSNTTGTVTFTVGGQTVGTYEVKPLPPADGMVGRQKMGAYPASNLAAQRIRAQMNGAISLGELQVVSFTVSVTGKGTATGNSDRLGDASIIATAKSGDQVLISNIKAVSPKGVSVKVNNIGFKVM